MEDPHAPDGDPYEHSAEFRIEAEDGVEAVTCLKAAIFRLLRSERIRPIDPGADTALNPPISYPPMSDEERRFSEEWDNRNNVWQCLKCGAKNMPTSKTCIGWSTAKNGMCKEPRPNPIRDAIVDCCRAADDHEKRVAKGLLPIFVTYPELVHALRCALSAYYLERDKPISPGGAYERARRLAKSQTEAANELLKRVEPELLAASVTKQIEEERVWERDEASGGKGSDWLGPPRKLEPVDAIEWNKTHSRPRSPWVEPGQGITRKMVCQRQDELWPGKDILEICLTLRTTHNGLGESLPVTLVEDSLDMLKARVATWRPGKPIEERFDNAVLELVKATIERVGGGR